MLPLSDTADAAPTAALSDADVVRRVRAGEQALFEVLLRRHDRRVYRTVRAILRDEDEVEDAMQQAWIQAYLHLGEFQGNAAFSTWLVRIAANEALQRLRRRGPLAPVATSGDEEDAMSPAEDPEERAAAREAIELLERAVDALPPHHRLVFVLREVEGLSTAETAAALGIAEDAAKVRLHRAKAALRRALEETVGGAAQDAFPFHAPRCNRIVSRVMEAIARLGPGAA
ncbi:MAG TPA: RNA polymerase sigma factor [Anaeromyxobacter sp.]